MVRAEVRAVAASARPQPSISAVECAVMRPVYGGTDVVRRILGVNRHRAPEGPILSDSVNSGVNPDYPRIRRST